MTKIDSKIPEGPVAEKWTNYKAHQKLVNPANKRRLDIIVVGTGTATLITRTTISGVNGVFTPLFPKDIGIDHRTGRYLATAITSYFRNKANTNTVNLRSAYFCCRLHTFLTGRRDRKSTRLNSSHQPQSRMPSSA